MNKLFVLLILVSLFLFGCTSSNFTEEIKSLGNFNYEEIEISKEYSILPFPGLKYNGIRDNFQYFSTEKENFQFSIYASPSVEKTDLTFNELKKSFSNSFSKVDSFAKCNSISTNNWLTKKDAFSCNYYNYSIGANYKLVVFYDSGEFVRTMIGVWGKDLLEYEYVFDEFNQKVVNWN
jgi:hypothetical protein